MIFLIFILIFVVFVFFCMIGFVGFKIKNRKLIKEVDEEVRIEQELDKDCFYLCYFVLLEFVQEWDRYQGFVILDDRGQVIDVKYWIFE